MSIEHLSGTTTAEAIGAVLARDGVAVVDELVPPAMMERVRAELAPYLEATRSGPDEFSGRRTRRRRGRSLQTFTLLNTSAAEGGRL